MTRKTKGFRVAVRSIAGSGSERGPVPPRLTAQAAKCGAGGVEDAGELKRALSRTRRVRDRSARDSEAASLETRGCYMQ
jgi:hypothetical protein